MLCVSGSLNECEVGTDVVLALVVCGQHWYVEWETLIYGTDVVYGQYSVPWEVWPGLATPLPQ